MIARSLLLVFTLSLITTFMSCDGGDDGPTITEAERVTALLIGDATTGTTWNINSVDVDGIDYLDEFTGLSIQFSDGAITSTNGKELFASTDSWTLNENATIITRGDGLEMTIDTIESNRLILVFVVDETIFGNGRSEAVSGTNTLTFTK